MSKVNRLIFILICAGASFALLVASLMCAVKLAAVGQELGSMESQLSILREQNELLQAQYQSSLSLEELEEIALGELGMQRLSPGQIYYLELN